MYEGLTSRMALKGSLPASIVDEEDKKLLISERISDFDAFSYYFKISSRDHYLLIFKFIEVFQTLFRLSTKINKSEFLILKLETKSFTVLIFSEKEVMEMYYTSGYPSI